MDKHIDKVCMVLGLAVLVTATTKNDVFARYSGHIDALEVEVHHNGWREQQPEAEIQRYEMHPWIETEENIDKMLDKVISDLNSLLTKEDT